MKRSPWCKENFDWKGRIVKVVEDCDILKDQIPVYISRVTKETECIEWLDLMIRGEAMPRKNTHNGQRKSVVIFENSLLQEEKGMIMRENKSNRASLEAKIQRSIL